MGFAREMATVDGVGEATPVTYLSGLIDDPAEPSRPLPITIKAVQQPPAYTGLETWPETALMPVILGGETGRPDRRAAR